MAPAGRRHAREGGWQESARGGSRFPVRAVSLVAAALLAWAQVTSGQDAMDPVTLVHEFARPAGWSSISSAVHIEGRYAVACGAGEGCVVARATDLWGQGESWEDYTVLYPPAGGAGRFGATAVFLSTSPRGTWEPMLVVSDEGDGVGTRGRVHVYRMEPCGEAGACAGADVAGTMVTLEDPGADPAAAGSRYGAAMDFTAYSLSPGGAVTSDPMLLVGAPGHDGGKGGVYLFDLNESGTFVQRHGWEPASLPPSLGPRISFGAAINVIPGGVAVGAPGDTSTPGAVALARITTEVDRSSSSTPAPVEWHIVREGDSPGDTYTFVTSFTGLKIATSEVGVLFVVQPDLDEVPLGSGLTSLRIQLAIFSSLYNVDGHYELLELRVSEGGHLDLSNLSVLTRSQGPRSAAEDVTGLLEVGEGFFDPPVYVGFGLYDASYGGKLYISNNGGNSLGQLGRDLPGELASFVGSQAFTSVSARGTGGICHYTPTPEQERTICESRVLLGDPPPSAPPPDEAGAKLEAHYEFSTPPGWARAAAGGVAGEGRYAAACWAGDGCVVAHASGAEVAWREYAVLGVVGGGAGRFGAAVAVHAEGGMAAVGDAGDEGIAGRVHVYGLDACGTAGGCTGDEVAASVQTVEYPGSDGAGGRGFGSAVGWGLAGGSLAPGGELVLVVGDPGHDGGGGAVYVLVTSDAGGDWTVRSSGGVLVPPPEFQGAGFGAALSVFGDHIGVGASGGEASVAGPGGAFVYVGGEAGALVEIENPAPEGGDRFGARIALGAPPIHLAGAGLGNTTEPGAAVSPQSRYVVGMAGAPGVAKFQIVVVSIPRAHIGADLSYVLEGYTLVDALERYVYVETPSGALARGLFAADWEETGVEPIPLGVPLGQVPRVGQLAAERGPGECVGDITTGATAGGRCWDFFVIPGPNGGGSGAAIMGAPLLPPAPPAPAPPQPPASSSSLPLPVVAGACAAAVALTAAAAAWWVWQRKAQQDRIGPPSVFSDSTGRSSSLTEGRSASSTVSVIPFNELTLMNKLDAGSFKTVYMGRWGGNEVAIATVPEEAAIKQEVTVMASLSRHPNLVQMYGLSRRPGSDETYLVMELVPLGSLIRLLHAKGSKFSEEDRLLVCQQICSGMVALASEEMVHADLAARNVLVQSMDPIVVKVGDFGLSKTSALYYGSDKSTVPVRWSAPEVLFKGKWTEKSDVWAFGVTMWEVFTDGDVPYGLGASNADIEEDVLEGRRLERPMGCSDFAWGMMESCWAMDAGARPSFREISALLGAEERSQSGSIATGGDSSRGCSSGSGGTGKFTATGLPGDGLKGAMGQGGGSRMVTIFMPEGVAAGRPPGQISSGESRGHASSMGSSL